MFGKSFVQVIIATVILAGTVHSQAFTNTIYVISNAETKSLGVPGLSPVGLDRAANCIVPVFNSFDVGLIVTCSYDFESGLCGETEATAAPLAAALSLTPDTTCRADDDDDDDEDCLYRVISTFAQSNPTKSILVVWDWNAIDDIFDDLDIDDDDIDFEDTNKDDDDTSHFDLVATIANNRITSIASMACPNIDVEAGARRRRSLPRRKARSMKKRDALAFHSRITRGHKA